MGKTPIWRSSRIGIGVCLSEFIINILEIFNCELTKHNFLGSNPRSATIVNSLVMVWVWNPA